MSAPLHTCCEARNEGLYQKPFTELADPQGIGQQYVWLNLDIDVISIGNIPARYYRPVMSLVQRVNLDREYTEYWSCEDFDNFCGFTNVKEIHLVPLEGLWVWHRV